jgi:isocitrate lyase
LIWCETSEPNLEEAARFASAVRTRYPDKLLAYNCSPSFNWKKNIGDATIAKFQTELAAMGYKYQFVTLAGFHALNLSMFELARGYRLSGMTAYARLQEKEFSRERDYGYEAVKHQRFVGTAYFDMLTQVIAGGASSTTALTGSTEAEQFTPTSAPAYSGHGPDAACQPVLGECPSVPSPEQVMEIKPAKPRAGA